MYNSYNQKQKKEREMNKNLMEWIQRSRRNVKKDLNEVGWNLIKRVSLTSGKRGDPGIFPVDR